jgi:hypothetical protein
MQIDPQIEAAYAQLILEQQPFDQQLQHLTPEQREAIPEYNAISIRMKSLESQLKEYYSTQNLSSIADQARQDRLQDEQRHGRNVIWHGPSFEERVYSDPEFYVITARYHLALKTLGVE